MNPLNAAVLNMAKQEHCHLLSTQSADGFELTPVEQDSNCDEQFIAFFCVTLGKGSVHFKYCAGFDCDGRDYNPYLEIVLTKDKCNVDNSQTWFSSAARMKSQKKAMEQISILNRNCGEARHVAFKWLQEGRMNPLRGSTPTDE